MKPGNDDWPQLPVTECYVLVAAADAPQRIGDVLAAAFGADRDRVLVGADGHADTWDWDWDAALRTPLASCVYTAMDGLWSVEIYAQAFESHTEQHVALLIARELGTAVVWETGLTLPNTYQLATADGSVMFAWLDDNDEDDQDAPGRWTLQAPVPEMPDAAIGMFDDVIWATPLPTPITESVDLDESGPLYVDVRYRLWYWEQLGCRMAAGWPPSGWYPARMFRDGLQHRDELETFISRLPVDEQDPVRQGLKRIDAVFRDLTVEDASGIGEAAAAADDPPAASADTVAQAWYWRRRPDVLPWEQ